MTVDRKTEIAGVFDRAAPTFDQLGIEFFGPPSRQMVALAGLRPGDHVLDLGTGRGASLFPAAEVVGPEGEVVGVDFAPAMVGATAEEARRRGLAHATVVQGDAEHPDFPDNRFEAVLAGFLVFFLADPPAAVTRWGRLLRPGGRLVLSTFTELTDDTIALYTAVGTALAPFLPSDEQLQRPDDDERLTRTPEWLAALFAEADLVDVETFETEVRSAFTAPDRYWDFLLSAGGRGLIEPIPDDRRPAARAALAEAVEPFLRQPDGTFTQTTGLRLTRAMRP